MKKSTESLIIEAKAKLAVLDLALMIEEPGTFEYTEKERGGMAYMLTEIGELFDQISRIGS